MATSSKDRLRFNVRFSSEKAKEAFFTEVSSVKALLNPGSGEELSNLDMMTALFALAKTETVEGILCSGTVQLPDPRTPLPVQSFFIPSDIKQATPSSFFRREYVRGCISGCFCVCDTYKTWHVYMYVIVIETGFRVGFRIIHVANVYTVDLYVCLTRV